jgi:aryl-alcohol dehydrogenase-like predicted oxidoreductase
MEYRLLGRSGVRITALCLGTMTFGGDADEAASAALVRALPRRGHPLLDTADLFAEGGSQEILGGLMADCRDDLVVAT